MYRCPRCKNRIVVIPQYSCGCPGGPPGIPPAAKRAHALVRRALTTAHNAIGTISAAGWPCNPFPDAVLDAVTAFSSADAAARHALDREEGKE